MHDIKEIKLRTSEVFKKLGFFSVILEEKQTYKHNGSYYRIDFIENLDNRDFLIIESAMNFDETKNNLFEDSDLLPLDIGIDKLMSELETLLKTHYM